MNRLLTIRLQYFTAGLTILYCIYIVTKGFQGLLPVIKPFGIVHYALLSLFIISFIFSFYNKVIAGILIYAWLAGVFIFEMLHTSGGVLYVILSSFIAMILGTLNILKGIEERENRSITRCERIKILLQSSTILYLIFFLIILALRLSPLLEQQWNSPISLLLLLNVSLFTLGFILSWRKEFYAGLAFICWFFTLFLISKNTTAIDIEVTYGILLLLQGALYILFSFRLKEKKHGIAKYKINLYNLF